MPSLFFWQNWTASYKRLWFFLIALFVISLMLMWTGYFQGANGVIEWEKIQEQKVIETTVHSFRLGPFQLTVPGESYVIFEYLQGSFLHHNTLASYVFLALLITAAMVLLSIITMLERFWFFAGMSLFILFAVSLRLDVLLVFGLRGILFPAIVLLLFVGISFYFKSFRQDSSFVFRFLVFETLAAAVALLIHYFSTIPYALMQLVVTAYIPGFILSIIFIIMVAHEIVASFITLTSQGGSKSLRHFLVISVIYMVNVFITALHEIGYLEWDFIYVNLYLLISISAILGLWGFRNRENLYENILPFAPLGAYFFLCMAVICVVTLGQLLGNANDAALKVMRDIIIFTHAGFGLVFVMYVISNFISMMAENLPVGKVLYKPTRMPYFTFRLAGLIVTLAFVFVSHWRDYVYHSMAGFYNYVADHYTMQGNETLAQGFYDHSSTLAFQNHRANYALAKMKTSFVDLQPADHHYDLANGKHPSDFSLVNKGNLSLWRMEYFRAIHNFHVGEGILPSAALSNNLAFAYAKVHNLDSSVYYISEARKHALTKASAETNFFAVIASEYLPVNTDSILSVFDSNAPGVVGNAIAAATLFGQPFTMKSDPLEKRQLDLHSATLLNNYIMRNVQTVDTVFINKAFAIADDTVNATFNEALKASLAYAYYHQGNVYKAQQILAELAYLTQSYRGKYNYIMGLWALEQGSPYNAHTYFSYSADANYKHAKLYNAIALTEAGDLVGALVAWDSVLVSGEPSEQTMARKVREILLLGPEAALSLGDPEKYQYARYLLSANDTAYFTRLISRFDNADYKAQALLDMAQKQFYAGHTATAIRLYNQTSGLTLSHKKLYEDIRHFELRMLASRGETRALARQINKGITFDSTRRLDKIFYTALLHESNGNIVEAEKNYKLLASWNPYFEEGVVAAANFYKVRDSSSTKPYDILAEAIQINTHSPQLLKAYADEALRQGFDDYAASALQRLRELQR